MTYASLEPSRLPLWIRIKVIPFDYCHFDGIEYIMSGFGTSLKVDSSYAAKDGVHVQVEVAADVPLRRSVRLIRVGGKDFKVHIEYEFFYHQCATCNVFGHDVARFPKAKITRLPQRHEVKRSRGADVRRCVPCEVVVMEKNKGSVDAKAIGDDVSEASARAIHHLFWITMMMLLLRWSSLISWRK